VGRGQVDVVARTPPGIFDIRHFRLRETVLDFFFLVGGISDMRSQLSRLLATITDTALAGEGWPHVLNSLIQALRVPGAAYIVRDKTTDRVDWACFCGLSAEFKSDYVSQFAALDPYSPLLDDTWTKLSECLPGALLRKCEWYNDFVLRCGVRDILATRLVETASHSAILGIHQRIGRTFADETASVLGHLSKPLKRAALCHVEQLAPSDDEKLEPPLMDMRSACGKSYYFHVRNGSQYPDETGSVFATPGEAIAHAAVLVGELAHEGDWGGFSIHVVNEHGKEIARVPILR
jgi:hypothetical protein